MPQRLSQAQRSADTIRARMGDLVARRPGVTLSELKAEMGIGWGALYHHLAVLAQEGKVVTVTVGRRRAAFASGAESNAAGVVLRGPTARNVALALGTAHRASPAQVATAAAVSQRVARYHLNQLAEHGLARRVIGLATRYECTASLLVTLANLDPGA